MAVCDHCNRELKEVNGYWRGEHLRGCVYHEDPQSRRMMYDNDGTPLNAGEGSVLEVVR